jgi:hypothetical protein
MREHRWARAVLVALPAALASAACATTAADFRLDSVRSDEAAIVGKMNVIYNGQPFTENCSVALGGASYKLDASGLVFFKVKRGTASLGRLACLDKSIYHYDFEGARLDAVGNGVVTYFGNATVTWHTEGGLKLSSMFGPIGAAVDAASNDGEARMVVVDAPDPVLESFTKQVQVKPAWVTRLLTPGR